MSQLQPSAVMQRRLQQIEEKLNASNIRLAQIKREQGRLAAQRLSLSQRITELEAERSALYSRLNLTPDNS